jgi:tRNA(Met) cytidine acetyltransferase
MLNQLIHHLTQIEQRCLLWVKGEQSWARDQVQTWLSQMDKPINTIWFGDLQSETSENNAPQTHLNVEKTTDQSHIHDLGKSQRKNQRQNEITDVRIKQYKKMLGQECDVLVYDSYAGLNPDALGALVGTIKLGGVCIIISPEQPDWIDFTDPEYNRLCVEPFTPEQISHHYIEYFINQLNQSKSILTVSQGDISLPLNGKLTRLNKSDFDDGQSTYQLEKLNDWIAKHPVTNDEKHAVGRKVIDIEGFCNDLCKTQDQSDVLNTLCESLIDLGSINNKVIYNQLVSGGLVNSTAVVLQSDRGRGKSSALGLFAGCVLINAEKTSRNFHLLLTAPHVESVFGVFKLCRISLEKYNIKYTFDNNEIITDHGSFFFVAPDELEDNLENTDLVLVDEAAAIPTQMLLPLIKKCNFAVFATTIHGYEGTGRGFEYKFKPLLNKTFDDVKQLTLNQPIRWNEDDFLESDINRLLMINGELANVSKQDIFSKPENILFKIVTPEQLIKDASEQGNKLEQLFTLLVNAHYKTTPNDLRNLLDGPNIKIFCLEHDNKILGAVLLAEEGNLQPELAEKIWQGTRRPKGHLLPQSLLAHSGFKQAGKYKYGRIIRIAIHPELQGQGLGSLLLRKVKETVIKQDFDFLATSFGMAENLVKFWQKNNLISVRLGLKAQASTGEYSLLMTQALNPSASVFQQQLNVRFQQTLKLEQQLNMRTKLTLNLLTDNILVDIIDTEHNKSDLLCFSHFHRSLDTCLLAMSCFIKTHQELTYPQIILDKVIDGYSDKKLIEKYKLTGEKQLVQKLRDEWKVLIKVIETND